MAMSEYHLVGDSSVNDYWMLIIREGYNWF